MNFWGNVNRYITFWKMQYLLKLNTCITCDPAIPLLGMWTYIYELISTMNVSNCTVHDSLKLKSTHMSIHSKEDM